MSRHSDDSPANRSGHGGPEAGSPRPVSRRSGMRSYPWTRRSPWGWTRRWGGPRRRGPEVTGLPRAAGSSWRPAVGRCSQCDRVVVPVRPRVSPAQLALWAGVLLGTLAVFGGVALWLALGLILWRNCRAVCPDCGHGPMGGNVGWTRESFILWAGVVACFLAALWGTFHLALLLAWLFTW